MSPTLENSNAEIIDCMLEQINQMSHNLKKCKTTELKLSVHKMEVSTLNFFSKLSDL